MYVAKFLFFIAFHACLCSPLAAQDNGDAIAGAMRDRSSAVAAPMNDAEVARFLEMLTRYRILRHDDHEMRGMDPNDHSNFLEVSIDIPELNTVRATALLFDAYSHQINPGHLPWIDHLADLMIQYPRAIMRIEAFTDSIGSFTDNLLLSEQRAQAVKDQLEQRKVPAERLIAKGHGELRPVADNNTEAGRRKNRRVEFNAFFPVVKP